MKEYRVIKIQCGEFSIEVPSEFADFAEGVFLYYLKTKSKRLK